MAESMVYYIIGEDPNSRSNDMSSTIDKLVGNQDKSLCVESFDLADADSEELRIQVIENAVNSLLSPPFLTPMRIVVIRDIGAASTEEVSSLIEYLKDPTPSSFLVVVQGGGRISPTLTKAWKPVVTQVGTARESVGDLFKRLANEKKLTFEPGERAEIFKHYGEDGSKISSLIERLSNIYNSGSKLSLAQVIDYFGESGNVAFYELANKVVNGESTQALEICSRMLHSTSAQNAKPMHPLQIVALLGSHFRKLALLDNQNIRNQNDAFAALGSKGNPYGAKMSWEQSKKLGSATILGCLEVLGALDVMSKGANAIDSQISIELGIISLCQICSSQSMQENSKIVETFLGNLYV